MRILILTCVAALAATDSPAQEAATALKGLDPVELCAGREVEGQAEIFADRAGFRYRFASAGSKAAFEKEPERFSVQWDGACGRMGPLGGRGGPNRFLVHEGRIFLFASDACRKGFAKDPARCFEPDDAVPAADAGALAAGRELVDRALTAHGGAAALDAVKTLVLRRAWKEENGGKTYDRVLARTVRFPAELREDDDWGSEYRYATVAASEDAFFVSNGKGSAVPAAGVRELRRRFHRHPLLILRSRARPGFQAVALGPKPDAGAAVETVAVSFDGMTTTLGIDAATGRIVSAAYRGRGPNGAFGDRLETYSDFREKSGILVPFQQALSFDGQPAPASGFIWDDVVIDAPIDPALFARPAG